MRRIGDYFRDDEGCLLFRCVPSSLPPRPKPPASGTIRWAQRPTDRDLALSFDWDQNHTNLTLNDIKPQLVELVCDRNIERAVVHPDYLEFWTLSAEYKLQDFDSRVRRFVALRAWGGSPLTKLAGLWEDLVVRCRPIPDIVPGEMSEINDIVGEIRDLLDSCATQPSFYSGTCPVAMDQCAIKYGPLTSLKDINLSKATTAELEDLTKACTPAPFGRNQEDVYDESYRKAWKMEGGDYMTSFNLADTGIMDTVKSKLLGGDARPIEAELYKLNVYSTGSFFKPHKDTPRSDRMFGSLVVVFPTPHEGGTFVLRHRGEESKIDFTDMISKAAEAPSVGLVAFFSDIDHEVMEVTSGYRVTLTYNLFFAEENRPRDTTGTPNVSAITRSLCSQELILRDTIDALATQPGLLLAGGYLGFHLSHQYPVGHQVSVDTVRTCLKGQDAMLARILDSLSLTWYLRVHYNMRVHMASSDRFLSEYVVQFGPYANVPSPFDTLLPDAEHVCAIQEKGFRFLHEGTHGESKLRDEARRLLRVTPLPTRTAGSEAKFIDYGNQALAGRLYSDVCLIVELPTKVPGCVRPRYLYEADIHFEDELMDFADEEDDAEDAGL